MDYMASIITDLHDAERMGTEHVYQSTRNRISDFINGSTLSFNDITTLWLQAFQNYLLKRQLSWNTISTYMRILRAVYYRAVDDGLAPFRPRLFKGVYTGIRGTTKRAIGEQTLRQLKLPTGKSEQLENARQLFMLLFMLRGIPFVDIAYMRRRDLNGNMLTYRRRKTGVWLSVHIEPQAMQLIEHLKNNNPTSPYLFPIISATGAEGYKQYCNALRCFNYRLKQLADILQSKDVKLSSYTARHSWATLANYHNFQPELICNAMGHSSVKVTETYFKRHTDEQIHEMNHRILTQLLDDSTFPQPPHNRAG